MSKAAPMSERMRRFLANPPRRISSARVAARKAKAVRRHQPNWLAELCLQQKWLCAYCGLPMSKRRYPWHPERVATLDHVLPVSRGGRNQRGNLVAACFGCNQAKGAMTGDEFRATRP